MLSSLPAKVAAAVAALTLMMTGAVGAGAAGGGPNSPGLVNDVLSTVGVVAPAPPEPAADNHGTGVSDKVHSAVETATPGAVVGQVACEAAHDRSTLPGPAQNPGQSGDKTSDCSQAGGVTPTPPVSTALSDNVQPTAVSTPNHGQSVSSAVHDAIATSTPGPQRGEAASEAACTAAHDRSTLPAGAQNANPQDETHDCTHPNSDGTPGNSNGSNNSNGTGHGNENGNGGQPNVIPTPRPAGSSAGPPTTSNGLGPQNAPGLVQPTDNGGQRGASGRPLTIPGGPTQPGSQGQGHRP